MNEKRQANKISWPSGLEQPIETKEAGLAGVGSPHTPTSQYVNPRGYIPTAAFLTVFLLYFGYALFD